MKMSPVYLLIVSICLTLYSYKAMAQTQWQYKGPGESTALSHNDIGSSDIGRDSRGRIYHIQIDRSRHLDVERYDGTRWTSLQCPYLSISRFTNNSSYSTHFSQQRVSLAVIDSDDIYITYAEPSTPGDISVAHYDGHTWSAVGAPGATGDTVSELTLLASRTAGVYLVYAGGYLTAGGHSVCVRKYNGSQWPLVGGKICTTRTQNIAAVLDTNGLPWVYYYSYDSSQAPIMHPYLVHYDGSQWLPGGLHFAASTQGGAAAMALDSRGQIYLLCDTSYYTAFSIRVSTSVYVRSGTAWRCISELLTNILSPAQFTSKSLVFDTAGHPVMVLSSDDSSRVRVYCLDYQTFGHWTPVGQTYEAWSEGQTARMHAVYDAAGGLSVDMAQFVKVLSAGQWTTASTMGITMPHIPEDVTLTQRWQSYPTIAVDRHGTPYISYCTTTDSTVLHVKKYTNGDWQDVGGPIPLHTVSTYQYSTIALDSADRPYVFYSVGYYDNAVIRYNDTTWEAVGPYPLCTTGAGAEMQMQFNKKGDLFILFRPHPGNYYDRMKAMKYSGGSWQALGAAFGVNTSPSQIALLIDTDGAPMAGYFDGFSSFMIDKYDGTTWRAQTLASQQHLSLATHQSRMAINDRREIYLLYQDEANHCKATMLTLVDSIWQNLPGQAVISPDTADYLCLSLDTAGLPVAAYADYDSRQRLSVRRYNGSGWIYAGSQGFSAYPYQYGNGATAAYEVWVPTIRLAANDAGDTYLLATDLAQQTWCFGAHLPAVARPTAVTDMVLPALYIAPNPTQGRFAISTDMTGTKNISVVNMMGQLVYAAREDSPSPLVDGSHWATGVYLCVVECGGRRAQVRLVKE